MPTRLLRDGILESEAVCCLGWGAEVLYRRLMSVVDDYGRFSASPKLVRAKCYPLQIDSVSDSDVSAWLDEVVAAGLVLVYAVDGKPYLQIEKFGQQVRAKSKHPSPDDADKPKKAEPAKTPNDGAKEGEKASASNCSQTPANAHLDVFVVFGVGVGDGDEGGVNPPSPLPGERVSPFDRFWSAWPSSHRKAAKAQCEAKWQAKGCDAIAADVLKALELFKASDGWRRQRGEFIPAPLVWLNQARWEAAGALARASPADVLGEATQLLGMDEVIDV